MVQTRESRALASSLLDDELLVRDGVAKLYLCWTAWTLAQWYHRSSRAKASRKSKIIPVKSESSSLGSAILSARDGAARAKHPRENE